MANALDFDDILCKTVELFEKFPDILEKYQNRYKYIMVDEYQDTNHVQFRLVSLLSEKHRNLCVVGDDDQSIYRFRGADIGNILGFEEQFTDAVVIRLEQNYRSTQTILKAMHTFHIKSIYSCYNFFTIIVHSIRKHFRRTNHLIFCRAYFRKHISWNKLLF